MKDDYTYWLTKDHGTAEHFSCMKELMRDAYHESRYCRPVAALQAVGYGIAFDVLVTLGRMAERATGMSLEEIAIRDATGNWRDERWE